MISKKMFYSTKNEKTARVPIISALTVYIYIFQLMVEKS